jgi:hypothetical protein
MNRTLEDYMAESEAPSFESVPRYFKDGDFVTYFLKDELYYTRRLDPHVSVYISEESGEMIGCKIKSVSHLLKKMGDFLVRVTDNKYKICLGMLFLTAATEVDQPQQEAFAEISRKVGQASIDLSELQTAA